jgi:recombinational DNA repair protein RecT
MNNNLGTRTIDYHTYKNKLLETYPESIIDIQLVYDGDEFEFKKESGKVIYFHKIINPFKKDKKAIGGYCVIKNKLGEFIEIMNDTEINKCKQVAKMKSIWNTWEDEMYLKTIIKRACKRFFYDIVKEIDDEDNKSYDLSLMGKEEERVQSKNTPRNFFEKLLNSLNKTEEEKKKLMEEWDMTDDDIDLQRTLFERVKKSGK